MKIPHYTTHKTQTPGPNTNACIEYSDFIERLKEDNKDNSTVSRNLIDLSMFSLLSIVDGSVVFPETFQLKMAYIEGYTMSAYTTASKQPLKELPVILEVFKKAHRICKKHGIELPVSTNHSDPVLKHLRNTRVEELVNGPAR